MASGTFKASFVGNHELRTQTTTKWKRNMTITNDPFSKQLHFRHHTSYILGQAYRYSPEYAFYIFSEQVHLIIFLGFLSQSSFIPPQNVVYCLMLSFLVHKIFTFYVNGALNRKCPAPGPKG